MLIKALCDYYDILSANNRITSDGFSAVDIRYLISLTEEGKMDEIIDCQIREQIKQKNGKIKETISPRKMVLPKRTEKPGIEGNIIEHRPVYIFGLNYEKDKNAVKRFSVNDKTDKAKKSHEAYLKSNLDFIEGIESPIVNAFRNFMLSWKPELEEDNLFINSLGAKYSTSNFAFCLSGHPEILLHEDEQIKHKWIEKLKENSCLVDEGTQQCAITGEIETISRIHGKIKGLAGGQASGTVLVGFNNPSDESYGNEQSYNSNISVNAMNKYTQSLNYLLSDRDHKSVIDDITLVFWAMNPNDKYSDLFSCLSFGNNDKMDETETDNMLKALVDSAREGDISFERISSLEWIDPDVDFYIVGLKPNVSRISLKFIYKRKFGKILFNIAKHQDDLQISEEFQPIPFWKLKKALSSTKTDNDSIDASLASKITESVFYGKPYPEYMLATVIRRIRSDGLISSVRAGIIKACLNRKSRYLNKKEEINLALDKNNFDEAYLCGRLFAVLEKLQNDASGGNLNRTIKDAYFSSASATPAIVFPKLLKLSQNHINKVKYPNFYNILVEEIMENLQGAFPDTLSLQDQGKFIIGYYHQTQDLFKSNKNKEEIKEKNIEE